MWSIIVIGHFKTRLLIKSCKKVKVSSQTALIVAHQPSCRWTSEARRLIALRRFFLWAKRRGQANNSPFEILENVQVKGQKEVAPRWLNRQDQLALLRAVRRSEKARDLALIQMMLGTGLRIEVE